MSELNTAPIWRLSELLRSRKLSAEELTKAYIERIERLDSRLGAYISLAPEAALAQARNVDAKRNRGDRLGPLAGIPLAIKDILCLEGLPTTCGSRILENFRPPFDATAVKRLRDAGAVFLGKANCDEFAMGSSNEFSAYKVAHNTWNEDCTPGGSSGGSAVAVSAGLAAGALGTDTGGSVRQPASLCGIVAIKPTYGRVSRYGLVAYGSSLDCIGPMTRCVKDAAILLGVIAGPDPLDSTSRSEQVPDYLVSLKDDLAGLRIGVPEEVFGEGLEPEVRTRFDETLSLAESLGAEIVRINLPHTPYAVPTYYIVACAEACSNLARFDGIRYGLRVEGFSDLKDQYQTTRSAGFGPEVQRRIMLGTFVLSSGYYEAYYAKGIKVRKLIRNDFDAAFRKVDLIASPTSPTTAFKLGEKLDDPLQLYLADIYTVTANLAGIPAISINSGFHGGLPIGFQLSAPHLEEARLFGAAYALETALGLPTEGPIKDEVKQ